MKSSRIVGFVIACIVVGLGVGVFAAFRMNVVPNTPVVPQPVPAAPASARIMFMGDLMVDRGVENSIKNNMDGDFSRLFDHIGPYLAQADFNFLNLEGPVTAKGPNVGSRFSFAMNEAILPVLVANKFKIVSFANNHVGDHSTSGFLDTLANLDKNGILYAGAGQSTAEVTRPRIVETHGLKIGFIGCTDVGPAWLEVGADKPGILLCNNSNLPSIVANARSQVDFLVFSAHWGAEYHPRSERQQTLAHMAIDNGADMVIGHHPHVIEATEWYKNKFIAYSLGNFIFDQYFSDETMQGLLVDATIEKNTIKNVTLKVVELDKTGNKYQPKEIRDTQPSDFITKGVVAAQTCPSAKEASVDKWLYPAGPDLDLGNYVPKDLIPLDNRINVKTTASCLTETAANALITMVNDMEKKGLKIIMTSGFRSRGTQETVHDASADTAAAEATPGAYPSVALPGRSEHQLGVAVDMKSGSDPAFSYDNFKNSAEYAWLIQHAATYGFVNSYQVGKESITGYIAEPWHWRYVGKDNAAAILAQGITPYEYLKNLAQ
jgi:poly-gamma-glutamate synthesis protein (capsule biosynthesis protein)